MQQQLHTNKQQQITWKKNNNKHGKQKSTYKRPNNKNYTRNQQQLHTAIKQKIYTAK